MSKPARISYVFISLMFVLIVWLDLATPLLAALFSYFALEKLKIGRSKWPAVVLFVILVAGVFYGFVFFIRQAVDALPKIADTSIPQIVEYARKQGIELPDVEAESIDGEQRPGGGWKSLKEIVIVTVKNQLRYLGNFAKIATKEFIFLIIGFVVAISLFLNSKIDLERERHLLQNNLYTLCSDEIAERFRRLYISFATVMGAQITISVINTALTGIFITIISLPYAAVVIGVTFLCGLLPIIGNIISNSVIVGIGFTISPKLAFAALIFLIALHKLEYFLNSKIIGDRIKNPVWLTLIALILGERLMGIQGMILAPVILKYVKLESSQIEAKSEREDALQPLSFD
jgi:predicted PurR-regulated permease PerM